MAQKLAREQRIQEERLKRELDEIRQCTFKPQLHSARNRERTDMVEEQHKVTVTGVYDRSQMWKNQIDHKVAKDRRKEKRREDKKCTFRPNLKHSSQSFFNQVKERHMGSDLDGNSNIKGAESHYMRIIAARQQEQQKAWAFLLPS